MGLLNFFRKKPKIKSTFYDGGRFTKANSDFWNANSDFETTASPDRDTLRARARWIHENNPIIANVDEAIADYVIGAGLKFQLKSASEELNKEVELLWKWSKDALDITNRDTFDNICSIALKQRMQDGEICFYLPFVNEFGVPNLKLQAIEVDRFALGYHKSENGLFYDGIETNRYGKPIKYHFENNEFENVKIAKRAVKSSVALNASDVLYYYKRDNRFSQYRGISEYKQVIIDLKNFSAYMRATVESARSRANIAYVSIRENLTNRFAKDEATGDPIEMINNIFVKQLRNGEKIEILDPNNTGDTYKDFVSSVVRLIANGRKVSYELAFRDYSEVNYSSARMSLLQDYKVFDKEFSHFCEYFYKPIFMRWFELECMKGSFKHISYEQFKTNKQMIKSAIRLFPPRREWVDPLKDAKGDEIMLANNLTTLEDIHGKKGEDWEEKLIQRAKEIQREKELGIYVEKKQSSNKIEDKEIEDE